MVIGLVEECKEVMNGMESTRRLRNPHLDLRRELLTTILACSVASGALVVMILLASRVAGNLTRPLSGLSLVLVALGGMAGASGWRMGWLARGKPRSTASRLMFFLPGLVLFLLLCVLSFPQAAGGALMLSWLAFLTTEGLWWWHAASSLQPAAEPTRTSSVSPERGTSAEPPGERAGEVFQQITRTRQGELEQISICLRIPFRAGQRVAVEHVAFCPPLTSLPELETEITEGPDATAVLTSIQPFGLRLEVRPEEPPDEDCEVFLEIAGSARIQEP